jgi:hypothetical protein
VLVYPECKFLASMRDSSGTESMCLTWAWQIRETGYTSRWET